MKNSKKLQAFGIVKGQVVNVEPNIYNSIHFKEGKMTRHIHLSRKLMKKFKEA
jgi:hypothetical protein